MAKIVLVNPSLAYSTWNADIKKPSPDNLFIRLGIAYLAAALKAKGHSVVLADLRTLSGWRQYTELLKTAAPQFVGISIHSVEFSIALEAARIAKETVPGVTTIAGGIHPTMFPEECLSTGAFDFVIQGEGELSLPKLIDNPGDFPRHFWGETPDLDALPFPDREIWPDFRERMNREPFGIAGYRFPLPTAELINVRGCPYNCTFCCGPGEHQLYTRMTESGKRVHYIRGRSVSSVISELDMLIGKYGIRSAMFHDDQFIIDPQWVSDFIDQLHRSGIVQSGFKWVTSSRADIICRNDELLGRMAAAGLELLIVGFESFSPRILKWFKKGVTVDQNFKAAEICRKHGIKIWANYILGVRTDTGWHREDDLLTVAGALKVDPVHYSPAFYTPVPGSKLFSFYRDNDLIEKFSSMEDLSNRGKMAAKVKGVDYGFLDNIMMTDSVIAASTDVPNLMSGYHPEMNGADEDVYIDVKSRDAATAIIGILKAGTSNLLTANRRLESEAWYSRDAISRTINNIARSAMKITEISNRGSCNGLAGMPKMSVVIPVLNGGEQLATLLARIRSQKKVADPEIIVIDSGSRDDSISVARRFDARVLTVPTERFNHGSTRQLGVDEAHGDFIVLTVQDALPLNDYWLFKMVQCLHDNPAVSVASGRQMINTRTDVYSRWTNDKTYTSLGLTRDMSYTLKYPDLFDHMPEPLKRMVSFVDDVCACYRADVIKQMKFSHIANAEDIDIGVRMVKAGHNLGFLHSNGVYHWHSYHPGYFFKRNYDGVKSLVELLGTEIPRPEAFGIHSFEDIQVRCGAIYHALRLALGDWRCSGSLTPPDVLNLLKSVNTTINEFGKLFRRDNGLKKGSGSIQDIIESTEFYANALKHSDLFVNNHLLNELMDELNSFISYIVKTGIIRDLVKADFADAAYKIVASIIGKQFGQWAMYLKAEKRQREFMELDAYVSKVSNYHHREAEPVGR